MLIAWTINIDFKTKNVIQYKHVFMRIKVNIIFILMYMHVEVRTCQPMPCTGAIKFQKACAKKKAIDCKLQIGGIYK